MHISQLLPHRGWKASPHTVHALRAQSGLKCDLQQHTLPGSLLRRVGEEGMIQLLQKNSLSSVLAKPSILQYVCIVTIFIFPFTDYTYCQSVSPVQMSSLFETCVQFWSFTRGSFAPKYQLTSRTGKVILGTLAISNILAYKSVYPIRAMSSPGEQNEFLNFNVLMKKMFLLEGSIELLMETLRLSQQSSYSTDIAFCLKFVVIAVLKGVFLKLKSNRTSD